MINYISSWFRWNVWYSICPWIKRKYHPSSVGVYTKLNGVMTHVWGERLKKYDQNNICNCGEWDCPNPKREFTEPAFILIGCILLAVFIIGVSICFR